MALAVLATLFGPGAGNWWLSAIMIAIGGSVGFVIAKRVQMTEMPQLVAAMHSLVGLAAVFVGFNAQIELARVLREKAADAAVTFEGFAAVLAHKTPAEIAVLKIEVFLGIFIGAITFTGSVVAFGKLAGRIDGKPKKLPGGHMLNATALALSILFGVLYCADVGSPCCGWC